MDNKFNYDDFQLAVKEYKNFIDKNNEISPIPEKIIQIRDYASKYKYKNNCALFFIDVEYAKWLNNASHKYYYIKIGKKYYLVLQGRKHYQMIGRIEPEAALLFERKKYPGLIRCQSLKKRFFHGNGYYGSIITYGKTQFVIPYWKCDTFVN